MSLNFNSQCNSEEYFCLSKINKQSMQKYGLNMSIKELQNLARKSKPYMTILTGSSFYDDYVRRTKVFRYCDFKNIN